MQNDTFPRVVFGIQGRPGRAGKPGDVRATASARGPDGQPMATDCRGEARDVGASQHVAPEMVADRLAIAFIGMQIDHIHLELATHMHRATQLETHDRNRRQVARADRTGEDASAW